MYTQDFALCQHFKLVTIAGHRHAIHAFRYRTELFIGPFRYWTKGLSFMHNIGISHTYTAAYISGKIADSSCGKVTFLLF